MADSLVFGTRIERDELARLDEYVARQGKTRSRVVLEAIKSLLEKDETLTAA